MSGSNDALTQFMLMQARQQQRRPSAQAQLAQQMMAQSQQGGPIWGTGAAIARAVPGILGAFMAQRAETSDREREQETEQRFLDRQDKAQFMGRQALAAAMGGGAPQMPQQAPQDAPQIPMASGAGMPPASGDGGVAASEGRMPPGSPRLNPAVARNVTDQNGNDWAPELRGQPWDAGLRPPTGRVMPLNPDNVPPPRPGVLLAGMPGATPVAAPQGQPQAAPSGGGVSIDTITRVAQLAASGGPGSAQAAAVLPQLRWQFEQSQRGVRPPMAVSPGQTVIDPTTGRTIFAAPRAPEAPSELDRLIQASGLQPGSPEAQSITRSILERRGTQPSTTINTGDTPQAILARADVDTLKTMNEAANQMFTTRELFSRARQAIQNAPEGQGAQLAPFLGQFARSLGIDIPGTTEAEVLQSITARLAPAQRVAGSGASSDRDVNLFLQAVPRLGRTRDGNLQILDMGERVANRTIEIAQLWRRHAGQPDLIERINALPPIFSDEERQALAGAPPQPAPQPGGVAGPGGMTMEPPQGMPRVNSPADAMRLPPGTRFMGPDGRVREVPAR